METGIKPGCECSESVKIDGFVYIMCVAGKLQEELCSRIPESEKKNLRIALGLEQDEVVQALEKLNIEIHVTILLSGGRARGPFCAKK